MSIVEATPKPIGSPDVPPAIAKEVHPPVTLPSALEVRTETGLVDPGETHGAKRSLTGLQKAAQQRDSDTRATIGNRIDAEEMPKYVPEFGQKVAGW